MSVNMRKLNLEVLEGLILKKQKSFTIFFKYYRKNWLNSEFLNANTWDKEQRFRRTNNCCESFNSLLNGRIGRAHLRISILIDTLKAMNRMKRLKIALIRKESGKKIMSFSRNMI